ncbi:MULTISPECIES: DUF4767 domain-containing protein [Enterococcus]|uniref:DUF4767 domain-containing protein n=1 Tax=Enterococcus TaxID=1350 RepID=UPI000937C78B|nr:MULTISPECIES: DUF4767 domain-containing protein [Enterococcus]EGP4699173.1 DUF4767 domain-containing protein [Enterococcus faecium]EGP4704401.1 DUF4767 domain-containing protein [Enterococcus faecium]EGP4834354.1 DUF4767 domain-containing protein [Enterococcus faecium]EGP4978055.1 DUF4767 domain-containing protein [Enterococcus faecium]EGP5119898.1 DUF4767 domain-containing protein [Enterococcus faecium]
MKKWLLLLIGMGILFTGCTSENTRTKAKVETDTTIETKKSKTQSTEQTTTEMKQSVEASTSESLTTESSSEEVKSTLWDSEKSTQLATFVTQWGKTLGQEYKSYNLRNNVSLYGTPLPQAVINGNWKMAINEAPVTVQWSEDGTGQADFNLVAVYSDVETGEYLGQHVYFFGFQNGQPKVYLTQQNQGNDKNYMYFNETQNQQLKQGFSDIVNGQTPQTPVVEESTQQATTTTTQSTSSSGISSWEAAKETVLNNKALWIYESPDKNEANTNIIESTQYRKDLMQDENGEFYPVDISTDDIGNTVMNGGKQFRVYTDGRISQRIGMTNNFQMIK